MDIEDLRKDIAYRRRQCDRQQREIRDLQKLGIPTADAEALLARMQARVDEMCTERDVMRGQQRLERKTYIGTTKVIRGTQRRGL